MQFSLSFCNITMSSKVMSWYFLALFKGIHNPIFVRRKDKSNATILITYITAQIKMSFIWKYEFCAKIVIFGKSIAGPLSELYTSVYTTPYSFGRRIKLIICQNRHELSVTYIHTYIIGHCNPSVRIIDLVSNTTYVVCVNFIHKCRGPTI